ncbi:hypothetical protein [Glycomyces paridis]|uniref:Uncharacterized protein n=1 Tax=Glycomyces paridis TaxID=2126555 RepID=A0A4S8NVU7_9ACTN|nr:hypothetical protein [Glycomyces paridis]THV21753.1 hypothetical protein E9998_24185 [Glycomyces paridis]
MDDYFGPVVDAPPPGREVLAAWICTDIGRKFRVLLDALAMTDDVRAGGEPFEQWDSEGWDVTFRPDGVTIRAAHGNRQGATYSVEDVRTALEDFWQFMVETPERANAPRNYRPDLPEWQEGLLQWEDTWQIRHPYRGRLGIPTQGPA